MKLSKAFTTKEFIQKAIGVHGRDYNYDNVIYKNARTPVSILCNKCKKIFCQTPDKHLRGQGCPYCHKKHQYSSEEFKKKAANLFGNKFSFSESNYINYNTKVKVLCKECNSYFYITPNNLFNNIGCPECAHKNMNTEKFIQKAKEIHGELYDYSKAIYIKARQPIEIICKKHGSFCQTPDNHLNKKCGCPLCKKYKGEEYISYLLKKSNIQFERNKKFNDLKDKTFLSFDFYLPSLNILIEYNGKQHYEFCPNFHKDLHDFYKQKHHDWLKRKYCKKNNITLIVISYKDFNNINSLLPFLKS